MMNTIRTLRLLFFSALASLLWAGCGSVPLAGRKQLLLVDDSQVLSSSLSAYQSYMKTAVRSGNKVQSARVTAVGKRIATATEAFLTANGLGEEVKRFNWEFNLIKSDDVNAFCMPGGKIVVYEGILNLAKTDDELAVVIGHEVAHAVAKHSNERMSQAMLAQYGAQILTESLRGQGAMTQTMATQVFGLGADVGVLKPFARKHEYEADQMGLILMSIAGYNPQAAIGFWQKMGAQGSNDTPAFLSTHPSDSKRAERLQKQMPEALKYYNQYKDKYKN